MIHTNLGTKTTLQGFQGIGARADVVCVDVVNGLVVGKSVVAGVVVGSVSVVLGNFPKTRMLKFVCVDNCVVVIADVDIGDTVDDTGIVPDSSRPGCLAILS